MDLNFSSNNAVVLEASISSIFEQFFHSMHFMVLRMPDSTFSLSSRSLTRSSRQVIFLSTPSIAEEQLYCRDDPSWLHLVLYRPLSARLIRTLRL